MRRLPGHRHTPADIEKQQANERAMSKSCPLTRDDLADAFRGTGLTAGDSLIVHSSFRSLGEVEGGPGAVIAALLDVIGPEGNLMLPTFNYTRPLPEPYYDREETPSQTGIITETGRRWLGAIRSLHPTHSVAVIGPEAEKLTRDHLEYRSLGVGSPIDRLALMRGRVLFIGVWHTTNSTIHVGEEHAGIPKVSWYDELPFVKVKMPDGSIRKHQVDTSPSCGGAFNAVEHVLRQRGQVRDYRVARARMQLMQGQDVVKAVCDMIEERPDILLCNWPGCKPCTGARRNLRARDGTGPSR